MMKYVLILLTTLILAMCGTLVAKGVLNKDGVMRLVGRPETQVEDDSVALASLDGTVGEKLEIRAKELEARARQLDEEETRLKQEIRRFEDLRGEVEDKIKEIRGELDSQESEHEAEIKSFAAKISLMKSQEAAKLLDTLDPEEMRKVLNHIEPRIAGKILNEMPPDGKAGTLLKDIVGGTQ